VLGLSAARPASAIDEEDRYRDCVNLSLINPSKAYDQAVDWQKQGGGGGARHCAALALVGMGRYDDAATILQQLAEDVRVSETATPLGQSSGQSLRADLLSQSGNAWLMAHQFQSAYQVLSSALKYVDAKSPVARDILVDRARASAGQHDFGLALNDLDKAIEIDPTRPEIYVYRASALRETKQVDLAAKDIDMALKLQPDDPDALLERGYIRQIQNNVAGAREDWQRVADMVKGSPQANQALENLKTLGTDANQSPAAPSPTTAPASSPKPESHSAATPGSVSEPK
jgi:tetratricopeptide (TPR) repeat protein